MVEKDLSGILCDTTATGLISERQAANLAARDRELAAGLEARGIRLAARAQANMAFADLSGGLCDRLERAGVLFYRMGPWARFVTSWETTREDIDRVLAALD